MHATLTGASVIAISQVDEGAGEDGILGIDNLGEEELMGAVEDLLGDFFGDFDEHKSVRIRKIRVIRVPFT